MIKPLGQKENDGVTAMTVDRPGLPASHASRRPKLSGTMLKANYKDLLQQALQSAHGIRVHTRGYAMAYLVREKLYKARDRLRRKEKRRDYDCLKFRILDGDLILYRRDIMALADDGLDVPEAAPISDQEAEAARYPRSKFGRSK